MPHTDSPRKPPRRFWLFAPYVLALAVMLGWSLAWLAISHGLSQRLDDQAARLRAHGWTVAWDHRRLGGYPFRLELDLDGLRLADPSGWALATPQLHAEAYAYAPGRWVMAAPQGVALTRPRRGTVMVSGPVLRASVQVHDGAAPDVAVEGQSLVLTAQPGAAPLPVTGCQRLGLYMRPLPSDQAEVQLQLSGATPAQGGLLARLNSGRPLDLVWDQGLTEVSALKGPTWRTAVDAWSAAGGALTSAHGQVSAADFRLDLGADRLTADPQGRLRGKVKLDLSHAGAAPELLGPAAALASLFKTSLNLSDGGLWLGPFRIGAAPKLY